MASNSTIVQEPAGIDLLIEVVNLRDPGDEQSNPGYCPTVDVWVGNRGAIIIGSTPGHDDLNEIFISLSVSDAAVLGKRLIAAARKEAQSIIDALEGGEE